MALKDERQMIPADNVDANGTPWATVGENIRKGSKGAPTKDDALNMLSALLGVDLSLEVVTCTLKPREPVAVDNHIFTGKNETIISSKMIVGFFVVASTVQSGSGNLCMRSLKNFGNAITLQNLGESAITGTIKLAVLLA